MCPRETAQNRRRTIQVNNLARVEGEGAFDVQIENGRVTRSHLRIFEPPRLYEAFLRGRSYTEPPDITPRICGICPIAYQMSSCQAIEDACGVEVPEPIHRLRRLIYCGEWIESHVLHIFLLHAPDFFGLPSAIELANVDRETVAMGLRLKKIGNALVIVLGGREIHPISVRLGGFYRVPTKKELRTQLDDLKWAREAALDAVRWTGKLDFPDYERDYEFVALHHPELYPIIEGKLASSRGIEITPQEYEDYFEEYHVRHSTALQSRRIGGGDYLTGPLARYNLNFEHLPPIAREAAKEAGLGSKCLNPYQSIVVRAVETVFAVDEAIRLIENYEEPDAPYVEVKPRAGVGCGITEAPRGVLYHRYRLDENGIIQEAKIVPPTSQNQASMEADLTEVVESNPQLDQDALQWRCEQTIRNYDPCISCSTHYLKLRIQRKN